jgi:cytochrome c-type biogenesis protein
VAIALARTSLVRFLRNAQRYVGRVSGGLVALAGAYVAYYGWQELRAYRSPGTVPDSGVTDTVSGWSYDISDWITDVGAVRIAVVVGVVLGAVGAALYARRTPA